MSVNNPLEALFAKGLTIEQFLDKYSELKIKEKDNEDSFSIFKSESDIAARALFQSVDTSNDGVLSAEEIAVLKGYDTSDGDNVLSESDIKVLIDNTIKNLGYVDSSTTPEEMYNNSVKNDGIQKYAFDGESSIEAYIRTLGNQIATLEDLIQMRELSSQNKIQGLQNRLDNLIINQSRLSSEEKNKYSKNVSDLKTFNSQLESKQKELKENQEELELDSAEMKYLESTLKDKPENAEKINKLKNKTDGLSTACDKLNTEIKQLYSKISAIKKVQESLIKKAANDKSEFNKQKKELTESIEQEKNSCTTDINGYKEKLQALNSAQEFANTQTEAISAYTDDGDYTEFEGDGKALLDLWKNKWTKELGSSKAESKIAELGGQEFFNKVCAISKNIGCNPNELMGVMNSESGVTTRARNNNGGATGLIQFMPKTAASLGTTTDKLKNMSALKQLDYVQDFYVQNKKMAGFKQGDKLDAGTLYSLTFLPAYAKREVLTVKGHKYYTYNSGLDVNHDGQITKSDLAVRVHKKMA